MIKNYITLFLFLFIAFHTKAQSCEALGQNPATAFPVCGIKVFKQSTVPLCQTSNLYVPSCSGDGNDYQNKNPFWYKFTCYQSGTLGFVINPDSLDNDYDWQLYDITGKNPNAVFTDHSIIVSGNWAGTYGPTGASAAGVNFIQCASSPQANENAFAQMPTLIAGHNYLLMISHFTDTQSGYGLSFGGGTASITDPLMPHLLTATPGCDGSQIKVLLNKKMKCSSLALNGSDFSINIPGTSITAAAGNQCAQGFDMDTLLLTVSPILTPGNYLLSIKNGIDGNTLIDNCDQLIPVGESLPVVVAPVLPTPLDSITKPKCAPQTLELVFRKGIQCNSIAADGSDFIVTGPTAVTVTGATGNCVGGISSKIFVQLAAPILTGGTYTITLKAGTDGGTISDECNRVTPPSSLTFNTKDTVNADFTYNLTYGCKEDIVSYLYAARNNVNTWKWFFDSLGTSNLQNPTFAYTDFHQKNTTLIVSNGVCSDTASVSLFFDNLLEADFEITNLVCPNDLATIKNNSVGNVISNYNWILGNGSTSSLKDPPPQTYSNPEVATVAKIPVELIIKNEYGCYDTAVRYIQVVNNCFIAVPTAFTPNGDGLNDYLYPLNAYKALNLKFSIYNRFGQPVFYTTDWTQKWDGRFKGQPADGGTYVWILTYTHADTHRQVSQKGTSILIR
jgi:gliding motility-associated-like protein